MAIVLFRLFEFAAEPRFLAGARRLLASLKAVQDLDPLLPETRRALPGSYPILGDYVYFQYPNWATKYLLDALLLERKLVTSGA